MNETQWDDYLKRAPHTLYGEMGRAVDRGFAPRPVDLPVPAPGPPRREAVVPVQAPVLDRKPPVREPGTKKRRAEDAIAGLVMLAVWASIGYGGLADGGIEWYWPVGGGFVAGWVAYRLLVGPLRFFLVMVRWAVQLALYAALIIGVLAALNYLRNGA